MKEPNTEPAHDEDLFINPVDHLEAFELVIEISLWWNWSLHLRRACHATAVGSDIFALELFANMDHS